MKNTLPKCTSSDVSHPVVLFCGGYTGPKSEWQVFLHPSTWVRQFSKSAHSVCVSHYAVCTFWKPPYSCTTQGNPLQTYQIIGRASSVATPAACASATRLTRRVLSYGGSLRYAQTPTLSFGTAADKCLSGGFCEKRHAVMRISKFVSLLANAYHLSVVPFMNQWKDGIV